MQLSYQELFSINVWHSYFRDGRYSCLMVQPAQATKLLFDRFGFRIRSIENRLMVYTSFQQPVISLLNYISATAGIDFFQFHLTSTSPQFMLYTQLPIDRAGQLQYNTQSVINTGGNGTFELTAVLSDYSTDKYSGTIKVNFSDLQYFLTLNDTVELNISFTSRKTFWQYYIITPTAFSTSQLLITNTAGIRFSEPENVALENGKPAVLFTSLIPLPLSRQPEYQFNLVCSTTSGNRTLEKVLYKGLPIPNPACFTTTVLNHEQQVCSPVYVYL